MICVPARLAARSNIFTGALSPSEDQWYAAAGVTIAMLPLDVHVQNCTASVSGILWLFIFFCSSRLYTCSAAPARTAMVLPSGDRIADSAAMGKRDVTAPVCSEMICTDFWSPCSRRTQMALSPSMFTLLREGWRGSRGGGGRGGGGRVGAGGARAVRARARVYAGGGGSRGTHRNEMASCGTPSACRFITTRRSTGICCAMALAVLRGGLLRGGGGVYDGGHTRNARPRGGGGGGGVGGAGSERRTRGRSAKARARGARDCPGLVRWRRATAGVRGGATVKPRPAPPHPLFTSIVSGESHTSVHRVRCCCLRARRRGAGCLPTNPRRLVSHVAAHVAAPAPRQHARCGLERGASPALQTAAAALPRPSYAVPPLP